MSYCVEQIAHTASVICPVVGLRSHHFRSEVGRTFSSLSLCQFSIINPCLRATGANLMRAQLYVLYQLLVDKRFTHTPVSLDFDRTACLF